MKMLFLLTVSIVLVYGRPRFATSDVKPFSNQTIYAVGSRAEFKCLLFNDTRLDGAYFAFCDETSDCSQHGPHTKFLDQYLVKNSSTESVFLIKRIPDRFCGKSDFVCSARNRSKYTTIYFGMKPIGPNRIKCFGNALSQLECRVSPSYFEPSCNPLKHPQNVRITVQFISTNGSRITCSNRTASYKVSTKFWCRSSLKESGAVLVIDHSPLLFSYNINLTLSYCNSFGCETLSDEFNRKAKEQAATPSLHLVGCTRDICDFRVDNSSLAKGLIYLLFISCSSSASYAKIIPDVETKDLNVSLSPFAPGTTYKCILRAKPDPIGLFSAGFGLDFETNETLPARGPIWEPGYFVRKGSVIRIYFAPPEPVHHHGKLLVYGFSRNADTPPTAGCTKNWFCDVPGQNDVALRGFLFSRNSRGWSSTATAVRVPPAAKVLSAQPVILWRNASDRNIYDVECPSGRRNCRVLVCNKPDNSSGCCRSYPRFRTNSSLRLNLKSERVSAVVGDHGVTSCLKFWVDDYCDRNAKPEINPDWFNAIAEREGETKRTNVSVKNKHFGCSASSRTPFKYFVVRLQCDVKHFSFDKILKRNAYTSSSSISLDLPTSPCNLSVGGVNASFKPVLLKVAKKLPQTAKGIDWWVFAPLLLLFPIFTIVCVLKRKHLWKLYQLVFIEDNPHVPLPLGTVSLQHVYNYASADTLSGSVSSVRQGICHIPQTLSTDVPYSSSSCSEPLISNSESQETRDTPRILLSAANGLSDEAPAEESDLYISRIQDDVFST